MNKSNLHKELSNTQANASVIESEVDEFASEEKELQGESLLPPELSFPAPQEETEDLQEEVNAEEKQESVAASLQTADEDDSPSDSSNDSSANEDNTPTLQLKNSTPKEQTKANGKASETLQKQSETTETEDQQEAKASEQQEPASLSLQTADDDSPSENNNKPTGANGNSSTVSTDRPYQLKKSTPKEQTNPISGFQVSETLQKQAESPEKPKFELSETYLQKQSCRSCC